MEGRSRRGGRCSVGTGYKTTCSPADAQANGGGPAIRRRSGRSKQRVAPVDQKGVAQKIGKLVPGYMAMGESGMGNMVEMAGMMPGPKNTLPMMIGTGQFGPIDMGGMFTILKVRDGITNYDDPGWYQNPPGTVASPLPGSDSPKEHAHHDHT